MWKVEKEGASASYLFGTIASDDKRLLKLPQPVLDAFKESNTIAFRTRPVRVVMTKREIFSGRYHHYVFRDGQSARLLLNEDLWNAALEIGEPRGITKNMLFVMKPWALARVLYLQASSKRQLKKSPRLANTRFPIIHEHLLKEAEEANLYIETLEDRPYKPLLALDRLSTEDQNALVQYAVDDLRKLTNKRRAKTEDKKDSRAARYLDKNIKGVCELEPWSRLSKSGSRIFRDKFLKLANRRLINTAEPMLNSPDDDGALFIVVDMVHLYGTQGLVQQLKDAEFKVTPIY